MDGMIQVLWNCEMGENCINKERPGVHEEYSEIIECRAVHAEALQAEPA